MCDQMGQRLRKNGKKPRIGGRENRIEGERSEGDREVAGEGEGQGEKD